MRRPLFVMLCLSACSAAPTATGDRDAVLVDGRVVATLVRPAYRRDDHEATCKVYHDVFASEGRLLTKGAGGQFPHHRGLFLGWNQVQWHGERFDFWHCNHGETQQFVGFEPEPAPAAIIEWRTGNGDVVLRERRTLRAERLSTELLGDDVYALFLGSVLTAVDGAVRLRGDPQHAGQQFRALQRFAEPTAAKVHYMRPATATAQSDDVWLDCAWTAAVLPLPDSAVTVLRIEGAANPRPTLWSTRDYGRFGATFSTSIDPGEPLRLDWIYVVALGERTAEWCTAMAQNVGRVRD